MPSPIDKNDKRVSKTQNRLHMAMSPLLKRRNFSKITVSDICEEALISRVTFYAYFTDKYDLLKYWLISIGPVHINQDNYKEIEKTINQFICDNKLIIKNILDDADKHTFKVLSEALPIILNFTEKNSDEKRTPKYIVQSNFFIGGMLYYLLWQVRNKFPPDVMPMNTFLYDLIKKFGE